MRAATFAFGASALYFSTSCTRGVERADAIDPVPAVLTPSIPQRPRTLSATAVADGRASKPPLEASLTVAVAPEGGSRLRLVSTVHNRASRPVPASRVEYWLSANEVVDAMDVRLCTASVEPILPAKSSVARTSCAVPRPLFGRYRVIARVSALAGGTSRLPDVVAGTVSLGPEIRLSNLSAEAGGGHVTIAFRADNTGTKPVSAFRTAFYLSTDATRDDDDPFLCAVDVPRLAVAAVAAVAPASSVAISLPCETRALTERALAEGRFVIAVADASDEVVEPDEANDVAAPILARSRLAPVVAAESAKVLDGTPTSSLLSARTP